MPPRVKLEDFSLGSHIFVYGDKAYKAEDLFEIAKGVKAFDLPLAGVNLSSTPWGEQNIKSICHHMKRVNEADMSYPVILDDEGYICDGWHRVCKAVLEGRETIKAIRLEIMPDREA